MKSTLIPILALVSLTIAAPTASPLELDTRDTTSAAACGQNGQGKLSCCNQLTKSTQIPGELGGFLSFLLGPVDVGLECNPITVVGVLAGSGAKCQQTTVCCNTQQNAPQTNNGINILNGAQIPICPAIPIAAL